MAQCQPFFNRSSITFTCLYTGHKTIKSSSCGFTTKNQVVMYKSKAMPHQIVAPNPSQQVVVKENKRAITEEYIKAVGAAIVKVNTIKITFNMFKSRSLNPNFMGGNNLKIMLFRIKVKDKIMDKTREGFSNTYYHCESHGHLIRQFLGAIFLILTIWVPLSNNYLNYKELQGIIVVHNPSGVVFHNNQSICKDFICLLQLLKTWWQIMITIFFWPVWMRSKYTNTQEENSYLNEEKNEHFHWWLCELHRNGLVWKLHNIICGSENYFTCVVLLYLGLETRENQILCLIMKETTCIANGPGSPK